MSCFRNVRYLLLALTCIAAGVMVSAGAVAGPSKVSFAVPPWPGEQVKAEVVTRILKAAGYQTSIVEVSGPVAMKAVASDSVDVDMAVWHPINDGIVMPLIKAHKVVQLVVNIGNAKYGMTVPDYVWKAGVHSIGDLHKYAAKFDHKIYGIEPGNSGNVLVIKAIKNNTYDLAGFTVVPSSAAGMMGAVKAAISEHKWIVFLGWRPHWMNIVYKIKFLDDPENLWGGLSSVVTIVAPKFVSTHPNVTHFLRQMVIGAKTQSQWIYEYAYKHVPVETVASKWIASHKGTLKKWLDGVTTADGSKPAFDAVYASPGA